MITIVCICGLSYDMEWEHFQSCLYHGRVRGLATDCCGYVPDVNYGGMEV